MTATTDDEELDMFSTPAARGRRAAAETDRGTTPAQPGGRRALARLVASTAVCGALALGGLTAAASPAAAAGALPGGFLLPFPCHQTWSGQTRTNHSPADAIDFNRADDLGDTVVASAAGTVRTVANLGSRSYGRYIVISHAGGWTTYYAHLSVQSVTVGQHVAAGAKIGQVGSTGGSTGPHLHFEERLDGAYRKGTFDGHQALYWGTKNYISHNRCAPVSGHPGTVDTAGSPLTVRSGPSTSARAVGQLADGARVSISCQTTGTSVKGTYGTSTLWDRIGTGRYIADAYVATGSDGRVAPSC